MSFPHSSVLRASVLRAAIVGLVALACAAPAAAQTTEGFGPRTDVGGLNDPRGIAIGDANGDGHLDLLVTDNLVGTVGLFRGRGDGTFQPSQQTPAGQNPQAIAVGDINGDGRLDVAVGNAGRDMVSVLLGVGDGTFGFSIIVPLGASTVGVALADVNHDGHVDLLAALIDAASVAVCFGNGNGTFQPPTSYPTATGAWDVAVADLNADGHPDLAVTNGSANSLTVLWNGGVGTFPTSVTMPMNGFPFAIAVADFTGDGRRDLAAALNGSNVSMVQNLGGGTFLAPETFDAGVFLRDVAAADLNGDGHIDLFAAGDEGLSVLHGRGDGTFAPAVQYAGTDGSGAAAGDFNGDGLLDVAMARGPGVVAIWLAQPVLAPVTTIVVAPATPDGEGWWYVSAPRVTVAATDAGGSGVAETRCVLDPAVAPASFDALPAGCAFTGAGAEMTADGEHRLYAASIDAAGNRESVRSTTVRVDLTPPTVVCSTPAPSFRIGGLNARVRGFVTDATSGVWDATVSVLVDVSTFGPKTALLGGLNGAGLHTTVSCPYTVVFASETDHDGDGLSNEDEIRFGLDPLDRTGDNGRDGDPDHDGQPNFAEIEARPQSHPRGFFKQLFAEGAVGSFFRTSVGLLNPSADATAHVLVMWLPESNSAPVSRVVALGPMQRRSFDVHAEVIHTMAGGVSTLMESDQPIAAMRDVRWGAVVDASLLPYGSTLERAAPAAAPRWYFAEGATGPFSEYLLLMNPNPYSATVRIEYLRPEGAPILQDQRVFAFSRLTVPVNDVPGLAVSEVAAIVSADVPIVAERASYVSFSDRLFDAGTAGLGATSLSSTWHFAEGATGFFDTFLLLANPGEQDATATVTYALQDGTTIATSHDVAAHSRKTVGVSGEAPALAAAAFSIAVSSTQPIAAERAMWWGRPWYEGDGSQGSTETGTVWAVGEGAEGGAAVESTFLLVSNGAADAGRARLTVVFDSGETAQREYPLVPHARQTVRIVDDFPAAADRRFSVLVESLPEGVAAPVPLTVEVARYQSVGGRFGEGGGAALATRIR